ncbi:peptidylprolyl isomerase [Pacificimonas flava]|uniref:Parvulin-like PPIase n=3 Tax=Sphingosinicellaceae TaxID=2820280 RepID=A0A219B8V4_9SPHN|nr:peptidylprolyl isomerase [Pacificimonas aurantium]OWV34767.1 peptidylprolyl isomerase [Pacificimonas flava]
MISTTLRLAASAAILSLATATIPAGAQNMDAANPILEELNRNPDITILAEPTDPAVRKATAVVNGDVVTDTDVDQRLNLVLASNPTPVEAEERRRLRMQVMSNLIDEKLQIQESNENDVFISDEELDGAFARVARNFEMTPEQFAVYLRERDTSEMSIKQQIRAELAWGRLIRRQVQPFVNVGDDEVEAMIRRMEAAKGTDEYRIAELVLFTTPNTAQQVLQRANQIVEQLRQGASFPAYARQYSESSTATVGGELGWVQLEQLPEELQPVVEQLNEGQITQPIQIPGAVVLLALVDKRQILTADEDDTVLSLKQMTVPVPDVETQAALDAFVQRLGGSISSMGGCGGVEGVAAEYDAEVTVNDQVRLGDLPPQLKSLLQQMQVGQSTPPFGTGEEELRLLTLCGREQPQMAQAPNFNSMYQQLEQSRVSSRAQRYLRDLRRNAIIDYR